ncbi:hypothetical protein FB451DRAFT_1395694 [Mycena latifolia]|nr:hypothetical protein FB451DRAFT_1395694 [Mycena latifolia]
MTVGSRALPWDPAWDARAEEVRKLCWGALSLGTSWRSGARTAAWDGDYLLLFPNEEYARECGERPGAREDRGLGARLVEHAPRAVLRASGAQQNRAEAWHETQSIQDGMQMVITKMLAAVYAKALAGSAVQPQAGDRKSGYQNAVIRRVTLSIHPSNTSPIRGDAAFAVIQLQCTALHKRLAAHCRSAGVCGGYALPGS